MTHLEHTLQYTARGEGRAARVACAPRRNDVAHAARGDVFGLAKNFARGVARWCCAGASCLQRDAVIGCHVGELISSASTELSRLDSCSPLAFVLSRPLLQSLLAPQRRAVFFSGRASLAPAPQSPTPFPP